MCKIVIAEDEYLERDVIKHIISGIKGARVVGEGSNGSLAVELCVAMKPHLIFINCGMGGMDGIEAAKRIRKFDREVVIVMTSANEKNMTRRHIDELDINVFLLKPVRPAKIEEIVSKYAKKEQIADSDVNISPRKKRNLRYYPNQIMTKEITRALIYIDNHFCGDMSLGALAEQVSLSSYYFSRLFKKEVGLNFSDFVEIKRLNSAKQMLSESDKSILEVSASVGYQQQSYFCKVFKKFTGQTPREYRRSVENLKSERRKVVDKYL